VAGPRACSCSLATILKLTNIVSAFIDGVVGGKVTGYVTDATLAEPPATVTVSVVADDADR
jgi:hypothetical protein